MREFSKVLEDYVLLQRTLLRALRADPAARTLQAAGEAWRIQRHGGGFAFRDSRGRAIDVHDRVEEEDLFDAWRIGTYLGSLGRTGTKALDSSQPCGPMDMRVKERLKEALGRGDVESVDGVHYRLAQRHGSSG